MFVVLAHLRGLVDGIGTVAQKVQGAIEQRPIIVVVQRLQAEDYARVPEERCRLLHDTAQRVEVKSVELPLLWISRTLQFGERRHMVKEGRVFRRLKRVGAVAARPVKEIAPMVDRRRVINLSSDFVAHDVEEQRMVEEKITLIGADAPAAFFRAAARRRSLARSQATEIALLSSSDEIGSSI